MNEKTLLYKEKWNSKRKGMLGLGAKKRDKADADDAYKELIMAA